MIIICNFYYDTKEEKKKTLKKKKLYIKFQPKLNNVFGLQDNLRNKKFS